MAIQHPEMVRNLIVISTAAERDGWYPEVLKGMEAVSSAQAEQMQTDADLQRYADVAPHPEQFPLLLDRMGELMKKDYDWRPEIAKLRDADAAAVRRPRRRLDASHRRILRACSAAACAIPAGKASRSTPAPRLAIVPGYTHYNFGQGPDMARVIEAYLTHPTSKATQFTPE